MANQEVSVTASVWKERWAPVQMLGEGEDARVILCFPRDFLARFYSFRLSPRRIEMLTSQCEDHVQAVKVFKSRPRPARHVPQLREPHVLAKIIQPDQKPPSICQILEYDSQFSWMSIPFLQGGTLLQYIREFEVGERSPGFTWHVLAQLLEALRYLHHSTNLMEGLALVHRDIHASNIMLDISKDNRVYEALPNVVLVDFGQSRIVSSTHSEVWDDYVNVADVFHYLTHGRSQVEVDGKCSCENDGRLIHPSFDQSNAQYKSMMKRLAPNQRRKLGLERILTWENVSNLIRSAEKNREKECKQGGSTEGLSTPVIRVDEKKLKKRIKLILAVDEGNSDPEDDEEDDDEFSWRSSEPSYNESTESEEEDDDSDDDEDDDEDEDDEDEEDDDESDGDGANPKKRPSSGAQDQGKAQKKQKR